ncbi:glutamate racemase [Aquabacterium sp. A7-Y]|uniref:glutamate racemase n=1 Tax=Aquabacterium sp. A7-Y TaxID=1349605 RepID=UPI00223D3775|nr:glutamate racemase [Aquabacterium sp. A7-Y]MCW7537730.1 glutamate racemase [Aquabacterium sp. A7-Y]
MSLPSASSPVVGVFDAGVGGLSVLRAIRRQLPGAGLLYVADSGHAPYGEREAAYVLERSRRISDFLRSQGARVVVIACNTATVAAIKTLRELSPDTAFVGVEPGLKPAVALSRTGRVGVVATTGTLKSEKFQALLATYRQQAEVHLQPCPGLAHAIEQGDLDSPQVRELVQRYSSPLREAGVDTVVLGCTHYPFVAPLFQAALGPGVQLVDTAEPVARQTVTQYLKMHGDLPDPAVPAPVHLYTSGDEATLRQIAAQWLDFPVTVQALPG